MPSGAYLDALMKVRPYGFGTEAKQLVNTYKRDAATSLLLHKQQSRPPAKRRNLLSSLNLDCII